MGRSTLAFINQREKQRGGALRSLILFFVGLFFLASAAVIGGGYFGYREAVQPGPLEDDQVLLLVPGSSVSKIADELASIGAIRHAELFTAVVRLRQSQDQLKAGEYQIPAGASVMEIIDLLVEGKSILHRITAPEGLTTAQILRIVVADPVLTGELTLEPDEGELLPETYAFTRGETRDALVQRMMKSQDKLIDDLWSDRATELPYSTPEEAIILASIVEKETALPEERTRIASVFVNRLRRGMRLESDPTIIYGLTGGEPLGRGIRRSELRKATPYNTYVIRGLPPTPIANPGREAIAAVLNPATTDDLFFVATGDGGHAFAKSNAEHERNVAAWRAVERQRRNGG